MFGTAVKETEEPFRQSYSCAIKSKTYITWNITVHYASQIDRYIFIWLVFV